ncbi:hypothetical protein P6A00_004633 [Vibrio parahaemolyticus]|uniref:Uncharacterized protein n=1 Tax=Vibrio parahaemolyticus TaxID=670 RepID=A0A9Q3UIX9_VIBPH|nr:hypothetical protein [Vibrio parahaemolyticus]EHR5322070.1 hypothetical protein [Vibrio parahaemolyticus]EIA1590765.1 hypothetical protein [Vibrio parahaemolyticus]EIO3218259.1 hypothetical protein [Vibrio parahaemolyticus]EJB8440304.1 hypothetical protein [Vibrio parahaemolyticus]EJB8450150.1 hypothetical protein [Vibrio parahaemolyticus]
MFFGTVTLGLTESNFFAETLLVEFVDTKADLLAEMAFSLVWSVPRGFSDFVESPHCEIGFPKALFGVVSPFSTALVVPSGFIE